MNLRIASLFGRFIFTVCLSAVSVSGVGCAGSSPDSSAGTRPGADTSAPARSANTAVATIEIKPNSPAEAVRNFYELLRTNKIREAIYMTNLRPAIEGLSDAELSEFTADFAAIAKSVPEQIQINGEIVTGDQATVTANLPDADGEFEVQQLQLKKSGDAWVIQSVDEVAEAEIKKHGKNYLKNLKIQNHQEDAKEMLERIAKAQMVHSAQNSGKFAGMEKLIEMEILPADVRSADSTGYNYAIQLLNDGASYYATATPAEYGRTGTNSYILLPSKNGLPVVSGKDNGGKPLKQ
jgi:hypothetical protein